MHLLSVCCFALSYLILFSDTDPCMNNTCQNGATCLDQCTAFQCQCDFGFYGDKCQNGKLSQPYRRVHISWELWTSQQFSAK